VICLIPLAKLRDVRMVLAIWDPVRLSMLVMTRLRDIVAVGFQILMLRRHN
jgi:hypothetical protein